MNKQIACKGAHYQRGFKMDEKEYKDSQKEMNFQSYKEGAVDCCKGLLEVMELEQLLFAPKSMIIDMMEEFQLMNFEEFK